MAVTQMIMIFPGGGAGSVVVAMVVGGRDFGRDEAETFSEGLGSVVGVGVVGGRDSSKCCEAPYDTGRNPGPPRCLWGPFRRV